ncbi:MAG: hypothetical protein M9932_02070 [Xanthobacteraceae bacterium]|nr:hypothetical protein [Xanthobacteraceae bacterium]
MTKSPQRARDASKAKSATRQRKNIKRTSGPPKAVGRAYKTIGVTAEEFFKAWSRKDRAALIEVLIESLDAEAGDPDLEDGNDDKPNLAGYEHCLTCADDAEADYCDDEPSVGFCERELDETDDPRGEGVDEDGDDNQDDEPSLGWTAEEAARGRTYSGAMGRCFDLEGESAQ